MLEIKNLTKKYISAGNDVLALNDVSLCFRKCEMVAILGQSGCGKTTLLNIIGGLDRATDGELFINGISTKKYIDKDWDKYRNNYIGFIFQNYNLIPHLTVLDNVAMALTLSGVGIKERHEKAKIALGKVGLGEVLTKKPNELSGGQMQRVSIARALVNDPDIILADEPTGALDVNTGIQVMELLKEVAKDRLVIMVTHNHDLADEYATRIVKISDGQIIDDTHPYTPTEEEIATAISQAKVANDVVSNSSDVPQSDGEVDVDKSTFGKIKAKFKKSNIKRNKKDNKDNKVAMSFMTALKLSFQNLRTKKGRTIVTSIAGSIGIIGVALVLAISSGMSSYINDMQVNLLSSYPITVEATYFNFNTTNMTITSDKNDMDNDKLYPFEPTSNMITGVHNNNITQDYLDFVEDLDTSLYSEILYNHSIYLPLIYDNGGNNYELLTSFESTPMGGSSVTFQQLPSDKFLKDQFELLGSTSLPTDANQIALVVDSQNQIDTSLLLKLGVDYVKGTPLPFDKILGKEFSIGRMNDIFKKDTDIKYDPITSPTKELFDNGEKVKITSIIRAKNTTGSAMLGRGLAYTQQLKIKMLDDAKSSDIVFAQKANPTINITTGKKFTAGGGGIMDLLTPKPTYDTIMKSLGGDDTPSGINIYPNSFESKEKIKTYLNKYNEGKAEKDKILCSDMTEIITDTMDVMINTITAVLISIAAVSLVVSTIMIGIIIYVSVVERTKEIGVLRSIGARKLDISRVFSAEAIIIGAIAGIIGIVLTYLLSIPINMIIVSLLGVSGICSLPVYYAFGLIVLSMTLTLIGGLFPAYKASQKDIVNALRTE